MAIAGASDCKKERIARTWGTLFKMRDAALHIMLLFLLNIGNLNVFVKGGRKEIWQEMKWVYNSEDYFGNQSNYIISETGLRYAILPREGTNLVADDTVETGDKLVIYYKMYSLPSTPDEPRLHIYSQASKLLPLNFEVGVVRTINTKGFDEAIRLMKNGDRGHFIMHPQIAYGHRGESKLRIPPNSHLEYFIEIVEVAKRSHMDNGMGYRPSTLHLYRDQNL